MGDTIIWQKYEVILKLAWLGVGSMEDGCWELGVGSWELGVGCWVLGVWKDINFIGRAFNSQIKTTIMSFKFEKIIIWQKATSLGEEINQIPASFPKKGKLQLKPSN